MTAFFLVHPLAIHSCHYTPSLQATSSTFRALTLPDYSQICKILMSYYLLHIFIAHKSLKNNILNMNSSNICKTVLVPSFPLPISCFNIFQLNYCNTTVQRFWLTMSMVVGSRHMYFEKTPQVIIIWPLIKNHCDR